jgi:hypothetical protein
MPWKERSVTEERLRFVARLLDGEGMSEVCCDFGISRKNGYKIFNRYWLSSHMAHSTSIAANRCLARSASAFPLRASGDLRTTACTSAASWRMPAWYTNIEFQDSITQAATEARTASPSAGQ